MKEAEAYAIRLGITSLRLMENAGSAGARFIRNTVALAGTRCTVICGKGNNGGDGFVVARRLTESGADVAVILVCGSPRTAEATEMFERLSGMNIAVMDYGRDPRRCLARIGASSVIVDAVFGTGFHGRVEGPLADLFDQVNAQKATVFALDMPSGADADTGEAVGACILAAHTVTFAAAKTGQLIHPAAEMCGKLTAVNIGIPDGAFDGSSPAELLDADAVRDCLPVRERAANKGNFGRVLCLCGSLTMSGAAYMASTAAARCGAGIVAAGVPRCIHPILAGKLTEVMVTPLPETGDGSLSLSALGRIREMAERATAVVLGCGLSHNGETFILVRELLRILTCPVVLDADGINAVAGHIHVLRESKASLILTPHPGEMARLTGRSVGEIQSDRIRTAADFAANNRVVLVLKGANTVIASPAGEICINPTGNPGMARGGSGDILAGMIAGFAAQGIDPVRAACCGAYIHGLAGDRCAARLSEYGMLPMDMLTEVPQIFRDMSR